MVYEKRMAQLASISAEEGKLGYMTQIVLILTSKADTIKLDLFAQHLLSLVFFSPLTHILHRDYL